MNKKAIAFTASDQTLTKTAGSEQYASNTVSYVEATFTLGENWTGFDSVRALWHSQYYDISTVLDAQGKCDVPAEVMYYKSKVYVNLVGVTANRDEISVRLTTYPILAFVVDSEALVEGTETGGITPSQFDQFVAQVHEDAEGAAGSAEAAADAAEDAAASAEEAARYMAAEAIADTFSTSATYNVGDYVMHEGDMFRCISQITTAGAWDANEWTQVTVGEELADINALGFSVVDGALNVTYTA